MDSSHNTPATFLYQRWLQQTLQDYVTSLQPITWRGKIVQLTPKQYGAALLQGYLGGMSLDRLGGVINISLETLRHWRQEPGFLWVMDWSKSIFVEFFCDSLIRNDYSLSQYYDIAGEFSLLEDSLKIRVRARLYRDLRALAEKIHNLHRFFMRMDDYDLRLFRRLLLFFLVLEDFWPSPAGRRLRRNFLPLAQQVVWPLLGSEEFLEIEVAKTRGKYRRAGSPVTKLVPRLKEIFAALRSSHQF